MDRSGFVRRAILLSALSVAISGLVGILAVIVGLITNRLSLLGFGFDAAIDAVASIVLLWRFRIETTHPARAERAERLAEVAVGWVLCVLAAYLTVSAAQALIGGSHPAATPVAVAISVASLLLLPPLALAKARVASGLGSGALRADSILTGVAALLALIALAGYVLTEYAGIAWADAIGGLMVAAVLVREGIQALRREGLTAE